MKILLPQTKLFEFLSWSSPVSEILVIVFVSMMKIGKLQSSWSSLWRTFVFVVINVPATHQRRGEQLLLPAETDKSSLKLLPFDTARTVVNSFVIVSIDCCNCLLANSSHRALNRLQRVMNAARRLVCHSRRLTPVSGLLRIGCACLNESATSSVF